MSLRENRPNPATSSRPDLSARSAVASQRPATQDGLEHFSAQSRLWGVLHERLGRAGVAQLLKEGPRDALELQILHVAGFVESTGVDATAYLPWNAPISWQDRTQPFYRVLLGSLVEREEQAQTAPLATMSIADVGSADLGGSGVSSGFVGGDLSASAGFGLADTMGSLDAFGGGWTGLGTSEGSADVGLSAVGAGALGGESVSLSRDALGEGPDLNQAFSAWFGGQLQAAGSGRALTGAEQDFLAEVHGRSFNDVRIHEGPGARQASRAIAARAFTVGNDIFIGDSGNLLDSAAGAELLAHEVTHVVQSDSGRLPSAPREGLSVSTPNQPHEQEAAAIGRLARAVFATFEEKAPGAVSPEGWSLDPSWDGDPIGQAVAAHLQSVLPDAERAGTDAVLADLTDGMRGSARSSVAGQHVLVDVAEALGEDPEIVSGLRGALAGLEQQVETGGVGELVQLGGAPDLSAMNAELATPGFTDIASGLLPSAGPDFAPLGGTGLGGLLFSGGASSDMGGDMGGGAGGDMGAVSRKASAGAGEDADATGVVDRAMHARGQGSSLPQDLQGRLEARLGVSLAGVRLHTDVKAAQAADAVNATAFTVGQDIYFNTGAFNPQSPEGIELIAHETTHAAQYLQGREGQATSTEGGVGVTKPGDVVEQEAEAVGAEIASGADLSSTDASSAEGVDSSVDTSGASATGTSLGADSGASSGLDSGVGSTGAEHSADASSGADAGDVVARSLLDSAGSMLSGLGAPLSRVAAGGNNSPLGLLRSIGPKIAAGVPGLGQAMPLIEAVIENKGIPGLDKLDDNLIGMLGKAVPGLESAMPLIQSVMDNKGLPSLKDLGGPALTALGMAIPGVGAALPLVQGLLSGEGITSKNATAAILGAVGTAIPGLGVAMPLVESLLNNKESGVSGLLSGASGLLGGASDMLTGAGGLLTGAGSMLGRASGLLSGAEGLLGTLGSVIPGGSLLTGLMENKSVLGAAGGGLEGLFGTLGSAIPGLGGMLGGEGGMGGLVGQIGGLLGGMGGGQDGGGLAGMLGGALGGGVGGMLGAAGGMLGGLLGGDNKGGMGGLSGMLGGMLGGSGMGGGQEGGLSGMFGGIMGGGAGTTSALGELGAPGQLAMQAMQIPGLTDLVNVVETGLANVAGAGKGLGRGSLAEGADTVGWIMQAVPGLPELVGVLRGGLADQMGNGSGGTGATQSSATAGEEQVGSSDRILGLDLNQAVSGGLSQVGGPTAGAAAQEGSPQGRGAIDTLDTALPGLSEFVETVRAGATQAGGPVGQATSFIGSQTGNNRSGGLGSVAGKLGGGLGGGKGNKGGGLLGGLF